MAKLSESTNRNVNMGGTSKKAEAGGLATLTQGLNIKGAGQTLGERTAAVLNSGSFTGSNGN